MAVIGGLAAAALAGWAAAYGTRERAGARFKQDPYSIEALKNLSATRSRLQDLGLGRNKDIQALLDELLAPPHPPPPRRAPAARGGAGSLPDLLREVDLVGRERTLGGIEDITRFQGENIG